MERTFEIVEVHWSGPSSMTIKENLTVLHSQSNGSLYQIYGHHPVYGLNVLLCIGRTNNPAERIDRHVNNKFERGLELSVRWGQIGATNESVDWSKKSKPF